MPPRPAPSRIAQALEYLQGLKSGVGEFVGGVGSNLAARARAAGGLAYEALTSDPNIGRMTTAEFSQAAADRAPTPRLDQAAQDIGTIGRAIVTQPVETGKAIVRGEVERAQQAMTSPQAAGQYAGSLIDPTRLAAALRHRIPISELDVYHGTPHKYAPTEANPLGEFDASKIGTGEGAQAYGHGIYLAENPDVAKGYQSSLSADRGFNFEGKTGLTRAEVQDMVNAKYGKGYLDNILRPSGVADSFIDDMVTGVNRPEGAYPKQYKPGSERAKVYDELRGKITHASPGSLYKADLPDEMIDRMLDWDKPFAEQPETVKKVLRDSGLYKEYRANLSNFASPMGTRNPNMRGENFAAYLKNKLGGQQQVSEYLRSLGIPGIRYLDAGSRGQGGSGTRNFVVFPGEEKKVRILERK